MEIKTKSQIAVEFMASKYPQKTKDYNPSKQYVTVDDTIRYIQDNWPCCGCGQCTTKAEAIKHILKEAAK